MANDSVSDMLTRIKNALLRYSEKVTMPSSKLKTEIAQVLKKEGYIKDYKITKSDKKKFSNITVYLKYGTDGGPIINTLKRVSKPGRRIYRKVKDFKRVLDGLGIAIISTPKGVMSDKECRKLNLGGEVLCYIY